MGPHVETILRKMCEMVNADYSKIQFNSPNWFMAYTWTIEQEAECIDWIVGYLLKNKEAREELMTFPRWKTKKHLVTVAQEFTFQYGWKYKDSGVAQSG